MCRMLGKIGVDAFSSVYELITAPHSLRQQSISARQPHDPSVCGPHQSGCGIAWQDGDMIALERRGEADCWDSSFMSLVEGLKTEALIAHNRKASPGLKVDIECSHPYLSRFKGEDIAFCHNGGIGSLMDRAKEKGQSDSYLFMQDILLSLASLTLGDVRDYLKMRTGEWSYSSISSLLLAKDKLFIWRCFDSDSSKQESFSRYYTLYFKNNGKNFIVASEPVDDSSGWQLIDNYTLICVEKLSDRINITEAIIR